MAQHQQQKIDNRKARFDFFLYDKYEAGISLLGSEVKSIREGKVNLSDSFIRIVNKEAFLFNCHISPFSHIQGWVEVDPVRSRKLLLHREEIDKLAASVSQKGFTIVPLEIFFKKGKAKVLIALAKGKAKFDKREDIKKRIHDRESKSAISKASRTRKRG